MKTPVTDPVKDPVEDRANNPIDDLTRFLNRLIVLINDLSRLVGMLTFLFIVLTVGCRAI